MIARGNDTALRLGVVIPTLNAASSLERCVRAVAAAPPRLALDCVVVDGGSIDETAGVAERLGVRVLRAPRGRGSQLAAGAAAVAGDWLLFLHADTLLEAGWVSAVLGFAQDPANAGRAGYFRFGLDDRRPAARRLEALVAWRCRVLGLPFGDQGLLVSRALYEASGGFRPIPIMEDVDLIRRIGRRRMVALPVTARTSAARYRRDGYVRRPLRNLVCLSSYFLGLPPGMIQRLYG